MHSKIFLATVALASGVLAQTSSDCNPVKGQICGSEVALATKRTYDLTTDTKSFTGDFTDATGTTLKFGSNGAEFTINKETDAPTTASNFSVFFARIDFVARASPGTGIVSSFVLQSADLDEIDWEWLGGDSTQVQTNYFSKGDTTTYDRGGFSGVGNPQAEWHTYTIDWTAEKLDWIIDGVVVRTLKYSDVKNKYPQTPMKVKIGTWVAGRKDAPEGTVQWAGGYTDFGKAPFTSYVKSLTVSDYCGPKGKCEGVTSYEYEKDSDGSFESIKINGADSSSKTQTSQSASKTSSVAETTLASATASGTGAAKPQDTGIGFVGSGSNSTTSGSSTSGPTPTTTSGGSSNTPSQSVSPNAGVKGAASLVAVASGLLFSYLLL